MVIIPIIPDASWTDGFLRPGCCSSAWKSCDSRRLGVGAVSRAPGFPSSPRGPCGGAGFPCALRPQPGTVVGSDNGKLPPTHPFALLAFGVGKQTSICRSLPRLPTHIMDLGGGRLRVLWPRRSPVHNSPIGRVSQMCSVFLPLAGWRNGIG